MIEEVPQFDDAKIAKLAKELYGIEGEISPLVSYEDQNARIKTVNGTYVMKIANKRWPMSGLEMQTEVHVRLARIAPGLGTARVVPCKSGDAITMVDGFPVRLLTYLEGDILVSAKRTPALYRDIGRFLGQFTVAMQGFSHPGSHHPDDLWNLDNVLACKAYLPHVLREDDRARMARFFDHYETNVRPRLSGLRKSVIHSDANEQNFLVASDGTPRIVGLIDFGDMVYATLVNDLAIALAYALLGQEDIELAAAEIVVGYVHEFPLESAELDVVFDLMAMRLVQSICMSSKAVKDNPENDYIVVSQAPARALLTKLEAINYAKTMNAKDMAKDTCP